MRADGDRSADGGVPPARGRERGRPAPVRGRRPLRLGDRAPVAADPAAGSVERRLRGLRAPPRRQGARHDPRQRRERRRAHDGQPGGGAGPARAAARPPRHRARRRARHGPLRAGRRRGATPTARARRPRTSTPSAARSASATSSCTARATARASRSPTRRATATACVRSCSTAGRARRSSAATATARRTRWRGRSAGASPSSRGWPRGCARIRCTPTAGSTTTCSRASRRAETRSTLGELPAAATAALHGDPVPLARLAAAVGARAPRARPRRRRRATATTTPRPPPSAQVDGGPFTGATWRRALGLAACLGWPQPAAARSGAAQPAPRWPARPRSCSRASSTCARRPRRCARSRRSCPRATFVRVRGAGALPALSDPGGCAATTRPRLPADARAREPRVREPAGSGSRRAGVPADPGSGARGAARRHGARPRPLDARRPARRHRRCARGGRRAGIRRGARRARARGGPARRLGARHAPRHAA